jgi:hypothetical protein
VKLKTLARHAIRVLDVLGTVARLMIFASTALLVYVFLWTDFTLTVGELRSAVGMLSGMLGAYVFAGWGDELRWRRILRQHVGAGFILAQNYLRVCQERDFYMRGGRK